VKSGERGAFLARAAGEEPAEARTSESRAKMSRRDPVRAGRRALFCPESGLE
jgi:hypothetical protein